MADDNRTIDRAYTVIGTHAARSINEENNAMHQATMERNANACSL